MIRVLIADDHDLVREGIKSLLADVSGITVVAEAKSGEEAVAMVREHHPDVLLLDVKMPGIGGLEATRRINRVYPDVKIIALTAYSHEPYPSRVLQAGAAGYLTKEKGMKELVRAIQKVFVGQRYLSPEIAEQLAFRSLNKQENQLQLFEKLSDREMQVLIMITTGLTVADIADSLCISTKTVNTYRYRLHEKLKVKNDVELTHFALRFNLIEQPADEANTVKE